MEPDWETVLEGAGALRAALIEAAFRERVLWGNMGRLAGLEPQQLGPLRSYIRRRYEPDGTPRTKSDAGRLVGRVPGEIVASIATFAARAIREGAESGIDRRPWVVGIPLDEEEHLFLTLDEASRLGVALGRAPDIH